MKIIIEICFDTSVFIYVRNGREKIYSASNTIYSALENATEKLSVEIMKDAKVIVKSHETTEMLIQKLQVETVST